MHGHIKITTCMRTCMTYTNAYMQAYMSNEHKRQYTQKHSHIYIEKQTNTHCISTFVPSSSPIHYLIFSICRLPQMEAQRKHHLPHPPPLIIIISSWLKHHSICLQLVLSHFRSRPAGTLFLLASCYRFCFCFSIIIIIIIMSSILKVVKKYQENRCPILRCGLEQQQKQLNYTSF